MDEFESLSHTRWDCKYHVVIIPKCRRKVLYGELQRHLGEVFKKLAAQKESRIEEGHLMPDHVHMMIAIPPKYAVSQVVGYIKGKSAIHMARVYGGTSAQFRGAAFLGARIFRIDRGRDEEVIGDISAARNLRTPDWSSCTCGDDAAQKPLGGHHKTGSRKRPPARRPTGCVSDSRFERLTSEAPGFAA